MDNLYRLQYHFQPIKFVKAVLPSPRETQPYNKLLFKNAKISSAKVGRKRFIEKKEKNKPKKQAVFVNQVLS